MRLLPLACLVVLTGCTTTVRGDGVPAPPPAVLGLRVVIQTEPAQAGGQPAPPSVPAGRDEIDKAKAARQNVDVADQSAMRTVLDRLDCSVPDPLRGHDDPALPLVACDRSTPAKYVLGPAFLTRSHVQQAHAAPDTTGTGYVVNLSFTGEGAKLWADYTTASVGKQVAIVIDTEVVSAPTIQEPIIAGDTVINGGFTRQQAEDLAARLGSR